MHEYAVTESILEIIQTEAEKAGARHVDKLTVIIGELTSFVDESIEFYFGELSRGTAAEGAKLAFENRKAKAVCRDCGSSFRPRLHALFVCPQCGSAAFDLKQGNELYIESIEVTS